MSEKKTKLKELTAELENLRSVNENLRSQLKQAQAEADLWQERLKREQAVRESLQRSLI